MKTTMKNELPDEIIKKCCPKRNTTPFINWRKRMKHSGKVCLTSATGDMAWIRPEVSKGGDFLPASTIGIYQRDDGANRR